MTGYSPEFKISCRLGFARDLYKARAREPGEPEKYGATLIIPKSDAATIKLIKEHAGLAAVAEWKDDAEKFVANDLLKDPMLDGDGKQGVDKKTAERRPELANSWFIRATATLKNPPKLFSSKWPLQPAVEGTDLYSGCYVEAVLHAFTWENKQNGKGITFNLVMARHVRDGEKLAGSVRESNPEAHFGKLEDAGPAPAATQDGQGAAGLFA